MDGLIKIISAQESSTWYCQGILSFLKSFIWCIFKRKYILFIYFCFLFFLLLSFMNAFVIFRDCISFIKMRSVLFTLYFMRLALSPTYTNKMMHALIMIWICQRCHIFFLSRWDKMIDTVVTLRLFSSWPSSTWLI
jgi:hypothetical protein